MSPEPSRPVPPGRRPPPPAPWLKRRHSPGKKQQDWPARAGAPQLVLTWDSTLFSLSPGSSACEVTFSVRGKPRRSCSPRGEAAFPEPRGPRLPLQTALTWPPRNPEAQPSPRSSLDRSSQSRGWGRGRLRQTLPSSPRLGSSGTVWRSPPGGCVGPKDQEAGDQPCSHGLCPVDKSWVRGLHPVAPRPRRKAAT